MEMCGFEYSESGLSTTSVEEFGASFQSNSDLSGWDFPWNMWDAPLMVGSDFNGDTFSLA